MVAPDAHVTLAMCVIRAEDQSAAVKASRETNRHAKAADMEMTCAYIRDIAGCRALHLYTRVVEATDYSIAIGTVTRDTVDADECVPFRLRRHYFGRVSFFSLGADAD